MPPEVAPTQVVVIPIVFKGKEKSVTDVCDAIGKKLESEGFRAHVDKRDITPGNKYYDWELKGVPLRVEIGPKDIEKKQITIVRRDTGEKKSAPQSDAIKIIKDELNKISKSLFNNAKKILDENSHRVKTIDEAKKLKGIVELPWCGIEDCALEVENILDGNTLGEPIDNVQCKHTCPICKKPGKTWMRYAKTY
jgi:prolyl-tRNA synthetase